jgi:hypothetical protein
MTRDLYAEVSTRIVAELEADLSAAFAMLSVDHPWINRTVPLTYRRRIALGR